MKASDSANSLTELTQHEKSCFICLETDVNEKGEPLVDSKLLRNCGCQFQVHPVCWNEWIKEKSDYDCPICRKDSMLRIKIPPNPVLSVVFEERAAPNNYCWRSFLCFIFLVCIICLLIAIVKWG